ncbi:cell wall glucanase [Neurospora crassa OR74A]|uniref:Crh-like protein n=1 Tax=Neurospora crassa (strain ATCC 24698 / 74-OR23-1A / CBS 708.71 / DSM 1257 / FGSC 987) TaxID=367110 RepID=Q7SBQ2_NEUCR|nr:cell wall glucanase [Neurospora crassa OR74A]EAA33812.1 cell wall glucanase [Neurospora crassa OR74A]|eukprot:XP_963048.1 cell wall glucanase [Neurospora crassa OR74A]
MRSTTVLTLGAATALLGAGNVLADDIPTCSLDKKCPESAPCCSQYGQCGVGAYCLGGCDPRMSFSLDSCVPAPVCQDKTYKMDKASMSKIVDISEYLGDPSKADWVSQGEPLSYNDNTLLTMPKNSVGTVLASTTYMWYGSVKARLKTSRGRGVVTAFILMSDVKDEIDYEFVGSELTTAQTNYYFQGIPTYANSGNISVTDTYSNWHEYEIRWTPDQIQWLVDGQVGRTKLKSETWNATANQWDFPQTPSRVQLSIWPGGAASNAQGTIDWAGGAIQWDSEDIKNYGYYFATFGEITVQCYDAKSPPGTNKGTSYYYNSYRATNDTVVDSDKPTVLASFQGTGTDMDAGKPSGTKGGSASATKAGGSKGTSAPNSIPGAGAAPNQVPGGGSGSVSGGSGSSSSGSDGGSSAGGDSGSGASSGSSACGMNGFSQSCDDGSGSGSGGSSTKNNGVKTRDVQGASALAAVVGIVGLMVL